MGEERVSLVKSDEQMQSFVRSLLRDVKALEYMLDNDWFDSGITRIGAEQEMCLIDRYCKPAPLAMEMLEHLPHDWITTELATFNLEANLSPQILTGDCFSVMERELLTYLKAIEKVAKEKFNIDILLTGIMPTLRKSDLGFHNLTPKERYRALMDAIRGMRGEDHELKLQGIDELLLKHESPLLEACNTSFQVHLQVNPNEFAPMYNIAQSIAGPITAISANSPLLFGKRLWHETRIALFQQSIDTRVTNHHMRERSPRVTFGSSWLNKSILEIYKEDIVRFRVLLSSDIKEDSLGLIKEGKVPKLRALQVHNSTVYRWNRPCYGISDNGKPHLRIENRVIPAGPTTVDEMANTAFWIGLMHGMSDNYGDIRKHLDFDDIRDNFIKSAHMGIDSKFNWMGDSKISACELIEKELLPLAKQGLTKHKVNKEDIDKYMGIIEERAKRHMNGARWILRSYTNMMKEGTKDESISALTEAMLKNQKTGKPVHTWELPKLEDLENYHPGLMLVSDFMTTDVHTVHQDDILELASDIMAWRKTRYLPVEDAKGQLNGLLTYRNLLDHFSDCETNKESTKVEDIMIEHPFTIEPTATIKDALLLMEKEDIGCLPVVRENGELVGMITAMHFLELSKRLLKRVKV